MPDAGPPPLPSPAPSRGGGALRRRLRGISLPSRLVTLILLCLLPVIAAETYTNISLRAERRAEQDRLALRRAEIASWDVAAILGATDEVLRTAALMPGIAALDPGACAAELRALHGAFARFAFLAVLDGGGATICASGLEGAALPPGLIAALRAGPTDGGTEAGPLTRLPGLRPLLPVAHRLRPRPGTTGGSPSGSQGAMILAGLDADWFGQQIASAMRNHTPPMPGESIVISDANGIVVGRYPDPEAWIGHPVPDAVRAYLDAASPNVGFTETPDGGRALIARAPVGPATAGLVALSMTRGVGSAAGLDAAATREVALVAGAAVLAVVLTILAGRRFLVRPMERLLQTAQRWRDGDLAARASVDEESSEFGRLAARFNDMASALQMRDTELRMQADLLEAQIRARTRDLSDSNNRLQVEMAEREKTEAALLQAQKLQAVGQLAGGIAHDFNNMLATILGSLELIERRVQRSPAGQDPEEALRLESLIERATDAVQRGSHLTARLLAFSRQQLLTVRPTDLNRLIGDLVTLASSTLGRRVRVRTDLAADLWPAQADPTQVEAAILNLCLNARDAMPEGGELTIATGRETVTQGDADGLAPGEYVRVSVRDTGCGMTPEVQARAFEPFFSTKGTAGSGLGLSQVYGVARQCAGTVRIVSTPEEGTEVMLLLPRARAAVPAEPPRDRSTITLPKPLRVMIVDDDPAVRQVTAEMLHNLGCEPTEASGADDALRQLGDGSLEWDVLVVDYVMPGTNGLDLARELRRRGVTAPIVLETGYAEIGDDPVDGTGLLDAVLHKPFTIRELQSVLVRLWAGRRPGGNVIPLRGPGALSRAAGEGGAHGDVVGG